MKWFRYRTRGNGRTQEPSSRAESPGGPRRPLQGQLCPCRFRCLRAVHDDADRACSRTVWARVRQAPTGRPGNGPHAARRHPSNQWCTRQAAGKPHVVRRDDGHRPFQGLQRQERTPDGSPPVARSCQPQVRGWPDPNAESAPPLPRRRRAFLCEATMPCHAGIFGESARCLAAATTSREDLITPQGWERMVQPSWAEKERATG